MQGLKSKKASRGPKKSSKRDPNRYYADDASENRSYNSESPSQSVASQSTMSSSLPSHSLRYRGKEAAPVGGANPSFAPADDEMDDEEPSAQGDNDDGSVAQMSVMSEDTSLGFGVLAENLKNAVLVDSQVANIDDYAVVSMNYGNYTKL